VNHHDEKNFKMRDTTDPRFADRRMQELIRALEGCVDELSPKQKVKLLWALTKLRLPCDHLLQKTIYSVFIDS
jgi:hypothetical protein